MNSDLEATYLEEGQQIASAMGSYFEWNGSYVRFKGGSVNYMLDCCKETGEWQCSCPDYDQYKLCPHIIAAQLSSLPVPTPIVMQ